MSKITKQKCFRAKMAEGMTQVVEHLLCKCKALSSNLSTTKKGKTGSLGNPRAHYNLRSTNLNQ
jgi:hypothetical protein